MTSIWEKFLCFLYSQIEMIYMMSLTLYVKHVSSERRNNSFKVTEPKGQDNRTALFPQWLWGQGGTCTPFSPWQYKTWHECKMAGKGRSRGLKAKCQLCTSVGQSFSVTLTGSTSCPIIHIYQKEECIWSVLQEATHFSQINTLWNTGNTEVRHQWGFPVVNNLLSDH